MKKTLILLLSFLFLLGQLTNAQSLSGLKIHINPGHGGWDSDDRGVPTPLYPSVGPNKGFWESQSNLDKGLQLRTMLQALGASVQISRTQNRTQDDLPLSQIVQMANEYKSDFMLSIHSNAGGGTANYVLMLYAGKDATDTRTYPTAIPKNTQSRALGLEIANNLIKNKLSHWTSATPQNRGDKTFAYQIFGWPDGYGVLRGLTVPGVLSEGSMHDYVPENYRLMNMDYKWLESWNFKKSIAAYFNKGQVPTGNIAGWVKAKDKNITDGTYSKYGKDLLLPLDGSIVTLVGQGKTYTVDNQRNGVFVFKDLAPGSYTLLVEKSGYASQQRAVTVTKNEIAYSNFELVAGTSPTIAVSPASLSFAANSGATQAKTFTVTGSNTTGNLAISSNSSNFTVSPTSLAKAGGTVTVTYKPTAVGTHSGTITISGGGATAKTVAVTGTATAPPLTLTQGWNFSETSGNKKDWATDFSKIRNMDYSAGKLYVVSEGSKMVVVNAQTGNKLGELSDQGVTGGALALIDVKVVSDGKIIASNVTTDTESPLKVYVWDNDNAHPKVLLETTNYGSGISRVGDCIGILGNTTNGTLYFASPHTDANLRIITYKITNGVASKTPTVVQPLGSDGKGMNFGLSPRVQPNTDGKYWVTGQNYYPSLFGTDNKLMATVTPAALNSVVHGNAFKAFSFKGVSYGTATTYATGATTVTGGRFTLFDATNGWAASTKVGEYPTAGLGTTRNTSFSTSLAAAVSGEAGVEVWVLVHNQGVAYFKHGTPTVQNPQAPNPGGDPEPPVDDPTLAVSATSLSFSANVNSTQAKTVTVTAANLTGNVSLSLGGANAAAYSISPASLGATGGTVTVTYKPTAAGSHGATLTVSASGVASKTVTLNGTAAAQVAYNYNIDFNEVWNYSQISGKTANWITNGSQVTQDMAFHDGKLYVVHRNASNTDNKIYIVNAYTGAKIGELNTTACTTGTYAISSIGVIGGKVVACNLAAGAAEPIVVYKWDNDNAAATTWLSTTSRDNVGRAGDKMSVSGDLTNGKIWFNFESKLYYYKVTNSTIVTTPTVVNLTKGGVAFNPGANSAAASIQENADGSLWVSGKDLITARFNASGVWQEDLGSGLLNNAQGSDASFFTFGDKQYAVAVDYLNKTATTIAEGAATLVDVTGGIASASTKGKYPTNGLGATRNQSFRSTVLTHVANDKAYMWVLVPYQGAAHYMYDAVTVGVEEMKDSPNMQIVVGNGILQVRGAELANIDLYSLTGQRIKSAVGVNELFIDDLRGVYIVMLKDLNNQITTQKIVIR